MDNNEERELKERLDLASPAYLDYFIKETDTNKNAILEREDPPEVVENILLRYSQSISGTVHHENINELAQYLLIDYYIHRLESLKWSVRINTYMSIEEFKLLYFKTKMWEKLKDKNKLDEESTQIQKTLAALNDFSIIPYVLETEQLSERDYRELVFRFGPEMLPQLMQIVSGTKNRNYLHALITRLGHTDEEEYLVFLKKNLQADFLETRLVTLKALTRKSRYIRSIDLTPFLLSEHWQERMIAAKICGYLQSNNYKEVLFQLMGDEVWWVRYRSAEAINKYVDGDLILNYTAENHADEYARDMAKQWIRSAV